jgi:hypothetical protein
VAVKAKEVFDFTTTMSCLEANGRLHTYLVLSLKNMSAVSYAMSSPRFVIESKRKTKRGLVYEKQISPKHCYGEGVTAPHTASRIVYSFDKVTLAKGQVFRIYFYEDGGPRNFVLSFGMRDLNK